MSEAIIVKRSGKSSGAGGGSGVANNAQITMNGNYKVERDGNYWVTVVGGGGAGGATWIGSTWQCHQKPPYTQPPVCQWVSSPCSGYGGAAGFYYTRKFKLNAGQVIPVSIGSGASSGTGGTTSFGTYLSAPGGETPYMNFYNSPEGVLELRGGNNQVNGIYGGYLYLSSYNSSSPVSNNSSHGGRLFYGEGGKGSELSYMGNSPVGPGNNGVCIVKFAD